MALKPEVSLPVALATGTLVYTIYSRGLPPTADIKMADVGDENLDDVRKTNAWMAASVVAAISLMAKDATVFIVGGAMVVGLDWVTRAAEFTNPLTGRIDLDPFTAQDTRPITPGDTAAGAQESDQANLVAVV